MHSVIPVNFVSQSSQSLNDDRERNIVSAIFNAILIVCIIVALALPNWYFLKGTGCSRQVIGSEQFFYTDAVRPIPAITKNYSMVKQLYFGFNNAVEKCVTSETLKLQQVVVGLCFATIFFSTLQFYFDITGAKNFVLDCTKRYSLGSIFSVILIIIIIGLCYYVSDLLEQRQEKDFRSKQIEVTFGVSYYLIATAGICSLIATASNLIRCGFLSGYTDALLEDQQEETFSISLPNSDSWTYVRDLDNSFQNAASPPPYMP